MLQDKNTLTSSSVVTKGGCEQNHTKIITADYQGKPFTHEY